jgi:ethanolamine utilization protein EutN
MLIAKVIGNVWSTKKKDEISALRLLLIQPLGKDLKPDGKFLVAADEVGAGFGERVIVTQGSPAMHAIKKDAPVPVDAVVVGIVDNLEVADEGRGKKK